MSGRRVVGGTAWTVSGYATMQVFRFAFNVALARMVVPEILGVMALVGLIAQGFQMFSDLGIRQCVIQHARGNDKTFLNTAWTVQILRGVLVWLCAAMLAWPLAAFYDEAALLWLLPLMGSSAFITGFASTATWTYSREVQRGPLVRREVGVYIGAYAAVLVAVWLIRRDSTAETARTLELAAIALGTVVAAIGEVVLSYTLRAVASPRFAWDPKARRELIRFGGWVFVSSGCTFFASQADRLVVGKLSLAVLGVYHIAVVIAALPAGVLSALGAQLVFPLLSGAVREGQPIPLAYRRIHRAMAVSAGLLITGMACVGPAFIRFLYNDQYNEAAGFIRLLAVSAWFTALIVPGEYALLALGRTHAVAIAQGVRLACLPLLLFAGYELGGIPGIILGVAVGELIRYVVVAVFLRNNGLWVLVEDVGITLLAVAMLGLYLLAEGVAGPSGNVAVPIVGALLESIIWGGVYAVWVGQAHLACGLRSLLFRLRNTPDGVQP